MKKIVLLALIGLSIKSFGQKTTYQNFGFKKLTTIENVIGFITTSDIYKFNDKINLYDNIGNKIKTITIKDEYDILALKCYDIDSIHYKVRLENGKTVFLKKNNKLIIFQTWEKHILSLFSVEFDYKKNPIKDKAFYSSKTLKFVKDEFYLPYKIKDEWLQVKWGNEDNWQYGWIKWREGNKLLISFYYFA